MITSPIITLDNFYIKYGPTPLIKPFNLRIMEGGKYCLVGKNGSGKSSVLKSLIGKQDYSHGKIWFKPGIKIAYLAQNELYKSGQKVIDFVREGLGEEEEENHTYKANIFLDALKIPANVNIENLSGGNKRRASLAKILCSEADLLLLDEPTNHLDIESIEWLENYLSSFAGTTITISHDREFLRKQTNNTIWIDRGDLYINNKGYTAYEEWSSLVIEDEINKLKKMEKELEKENLWLAQGVTARRKRNQQRLSNLFRLREEMKSEKQKHNSYYNKIKYDLEEEKKTSKILIDLKNISKKFDEKVILNNFNFRLMKGDKVAIIGANGSGKSTLIKIITGSIEADQGQVYKSPILDISYFEQDRNSLDQTKTAKEILCPNGGDQVLVNGKMKHVIAYLKDFMFTSEKSNTLCEVLSGGEQNRLVLAKTLANPGNLIILDEPTNDLDADTLDMLLEILAESEATVIIVSHDRDFLEKFVTRTIIFNDNKVEDVIGGYLDYKIQKQKKDKTPVIDKKLNEKKENKKQSLSYKDKYDLEKLEETIPKLTETIKSLEDSLAKNPDLYKNDQESFNSLLEELASAKQELEQNELKWLELEAKKEGFN